MKPPPDHTTHKSMGGVPSRKYCPRHNEGKGAWLHRTKFYKETRRPDGLSQYCAVCRRETTKRWRASPDGRRYLAKIKKQGTTREYARKHTKTERGRKASKLRRKSRSPLHQKALIFINSGVRRGTIIRPMRCENACCPALYLPKAFDGRSLLYAYISDYVHPLDGLHWLCATCHYAERKAKKEREQLAFASKCRDSELEDAKGPEEKLRREAASRLALRYGVPYHVADRLTIPSREQAMYHKANKEKLRKEAPHPIGITPMFQPELFCYNAEQEERYPARMGLLRQAMGLCGVDDS